MRSTLNTHAALITGGAIRIGRAIAIALAKEGYDIAIHYNSSDKEAKKTAEKIRKIGRKCELFQCDLSNVTAIKKLVTHTKKTFPDLNLLINSASIFEQCGFMETTEDIFDRHSDINFKAPFFLSQSFATNCKNGQIVNILDTYITKTSVKYFAYLLSKKSLYEFTRMAARALAPNIRVNSIAVGTTEISKNLTEGHLENKRRNLTLAKLVELDDITDALINLINTRFITGQCIFVDGGEQFI